MRSLIITVLLCSTTLPAALAHGKFDRWLDQEVKWIVSKREAKEFKALPSDESRQAFVDEFWRRRDPTLDSERNEYKEEFYRRRAYANNKFKEGIPGWRTDRGRIYLIHGDPDRTEFLTADSTSSRRGLSGNTAGALGNRGSSRDTIIWTYFNVQTLRYQKGIMLVMFQSAVGVTEESFMLGDSRDARVQANNLWRRGGMQSANLINSNLRFRIVGAGPPAAINSRGTDAPAAGIGDMARHLEDLLRSPGDLMDELEVEDLRREDSRDSLRQQVRTSVSFSDLPFQMSCKAFPHGDMVNLTLSWQIPYSSLRFEKKDKLLNAKVDLVAQVEDASGQIVDELFKVLELRLSKKELKERKKSHFHYVNEFNLPPGAYRVNSILKEVGSGSLGSSTESVELERLEAGRVAMSDLILSKSLSAEFDSHLGKNLVFDDWQILPHPDRRFSKNDKLVLYFKVYNAQERQGDPSVLVTYNFLSEDKMIKSSGPKPILAYTDAENRTIAFSSIVDLSQFRPGQYKIQVNVIDYNARQYTIGRSPIEIK